MKLKYAKAKPLPPISILSEFFSYNPSTGVIVWIKDYSSVKAGKEAGSKLKNSLHLGIGFQYKVYLAHRIAWALHYRNDPYPQMVDHINGNHRDNRISNLRIADYSENNCNTRIRTDNNSGYKGVCFHKATGKWQASIRKDNKVHYLGIHPTAEIAAEEVKKARSGLHANFARYA